MKKVNLIVLVICLVSGVNVFASQGFIEDSPFWSDDVVKRTDKRLTVIPGYVPSTYDGMDSAPWSEDNWSSTANKGYVERNRGHAIKWKTWEHGNHTTTFLPTFEVFRTASLIKYLASPQYKKGAYEIKGRRTSEGWETYVLNSVAERGLAAISDPTKTWFDSLEDDGLIDLLDIFPSDTEEGRYIREKLTMSEKLKATLTNKAVTEDGTTGWSNGGATAIGVGGGAVGYLTHELVDSGGSKSKSRGAGDNIDARENQGVIIVGDSNADEQGQTAVGPSNFDENPTTTTEIAP